MFRYSTYKFKQKGKEHFMLVYTQFGSPGDKDVASVISGNSLVGKKENLKAGEAEGTESKLILFNGLYYRGNWAIPFQVSIYNTKIHPKTVF